MKQLSKICDAADWFDSDMLRIIERELQEPARIHRKQWEFAIIYLALERYGFLQIDKTGLSMGGGNERVLYAIARHVRQLVVTDLYDGNTSWDTARTGNPDQFIHESMPFEVPMERIRAMNMDMRDLQFPDNSFDFCYSSCAFEHIGSDSDFQQHFAEVQRVLNPGGMYIFTTEFLFADETIRDENNYLFAPQHLQQLLQDSPLELVEMPDVQLTRHLLNRPLPGNLAGLVYGGENHLAQQLAAGLPHSLLMRGKFPFTSILLILRKGEGQKKSLPPLFTGYQDSRHFVEEQLARYRGWLDEHPISLNPFSASGPSRFFSDHAEFYHADPESEDDTVFHSDYFWFGAGRRNFRLQLTPEKSPDFPVTLQLRLHGYPTRNSGQVECVLEQEVVISGADSKVVNFDLTLSDDWVYAVVAKSKAHIRFHTIRVESAKKPLAASGNLPQQIHLEAL